ncbi:restriction endonuclease subunit S [Thermodesulfobacterium thermophilum]|uniref:restriction endonuclease subunit S n=1 Tax=Thermodesulfobacterium thermophilum TaxID=886 RepID=UPI0003B45EBC|nr:restriction endonuclease subunit S [Thermodesulfobacterium thermophilum]
MIEGPYKLPKGWHWVRLGEVCIINPRRPRIFREPNRPISFIPMSAIDEETGTITAPEVRPFKELSKGYTYFEENDILFAKITPCMENGKVAIARGLTDRIGFGSTEFHVLRPKSSVLSEWIWLFIRRKQFREDAKKFFRGGVGQQRVPQEFLEHYPIPLPPLDEQKRIVARVEELMSRIKEVKKLREETKKQTELLWQSVLAETFPQPGAQLPNGWRWVKLGEICIYNSGIWGPEASDQNEGFPIVRSTEIDGFLIKPSSASVRLVPKTKYKYYKLETGDILVNKSSGSPHLVGWSAIFEDPNDGRIYLFSNFMLRLRVNKTIIEPWFLLFYLHNPISRSLYLKAQDTTSGLRNLRVKEFLSLLIPLPPLEEQKRIANYLQEVHEKIQELKEVQARTEEEIKLLEQSILEKAFRGEL